MAFINSIMKEMFPAFIGGIVGLVVSVIFDDGIRNLKRNIVRKYKRLFSEKNDFKSHLFTIGDTSTRFYVIDGDGQSEFNPENIECRVIDDRVDLPTEIESIKQEIADEEAMKEKQGLQHKWNGPLYGLAKYRHGRTTDVEGMSVLFNFFKTDYFTFMASNMQLKRKLMSGETIGEAYIPHNQLEKVQPILANGFGVALVIITSDENIILTQRTFNTGPRGSEMDISVVEGVHPLLDRHSQNNGPDLYHAAIRGANEELGLIIDKDRVKFLGYGIDLDFYQWNMIGFAHVPQTAKEIQELRSRGTSGKWENTLLLFKNFTTKEVADLIINEKIWSTGKVALYWTAVRELGKNNIDRALKKRLKK